VSPATPQTADQFVLSFIAGKYKGGEFNLVPGKDIIIGRSSELDVVLVEDMVSRKHAKITFMDQQIAIADLGSTNGTFVNGERIKQAKLKDRDRILIGTSILQIQVAGAEQKSGGQMTEVADSQDNQMDINSGNLTDMPLIELLRIHKASHTSGILNIDGSEDQGEIYFKNGNIIYAQLQSNKDLTPHKSFYRILLFQEGGYKLKPLGEEVFLEQIEEDCEQLLDSGLKQVNKYDEIKKIIPQFSEGLNLPLPMDAKLNKLSPDQLDILQLVYNFGALEDILDNSKISDADVLQELQYLLDNNYIEVI